MNFMYLPFERSVSVATLVWRISSLSLGVYASKEFFLPTGIPKVLILSLRRCKTVVELDTIYSWVSLMDSLIEVFVQLWLGYLPIGLLRELEHSLVGKSAQEQFPRDVVVNTVIKY